MFSMTMKWLNGIAIILLFSTAALTNAYVFPSDPDPPEVTVASDFLERYYHASIIIGDYLYIDGGVVAFRHDDGTLDYEPANLTYSIDLSVKWTNQTVVLNPINKTAPVVNGEVLWADDEGSTFYAWGGSINSDYVITEDDQIPTNSVWQFFPNGASGAWYEVLPGAGLEDLVRPTFGGGAFGNGVGYQYGGFLDEYNDVGLINDSTEYPVPGIISYDFRNNSWTNTSAPIEGSGSQRFNQIQFAPMFGSAGVVLSFGGGSYGVAYESDDLDDDPLSPLSTIDIFDPSSQKWYTQSTSGPTPAPRAYFCSVGVAGDSGTFEIFIHGGEKFDEDNSSLDEIFVLSLPAFTWQQAKYPAVNPRVSGTCNARNNQMIIIGGYVSDRTNTTDYYPTDPYPLGIGVFDMTNLAFQDHYDPNAPSYKTPQVLKDYYRDNGMYPSSWDDTALAGLFVKAVNTSSTPNPEPANDEPTSGSSSHTGAIAGGVVGGVVGLALVGVLAWWLLVRRRKTTTPDYQQAQAADHYAADTQAPEKGFHEQAAFDPVKQSPAMSSSPGMQSPEMQNGAFGAQQPYHEVHAQDVRHEADGLAVRQDEEGAHELQS